MLSLGCVVLSHSVSLLSPFQQCKQGKAGESAWRHHPGGDCQQHPDGVVDLLAKLIFSGRFGNPSMRHGQQQVCTALPTPSSALLPLSSSWQVLRTFFPCLLTLQVYNELYMAYCAYRVFLLEDSDCCSCAKKTNPVDSGVPRGC